MRIFLIDDEPLMLDMLEEAVRKAVPSAEITCFDSTFAMLEEANKLPPEIVFMDIHMPGMDGITLAQELQKLNARVNLIFVTGYSQYGLEAMRIFASGYIMKPVDVDEVCRVMANLRYKVGEEKPAFAYTFGNFTLYVSGKPVVFRSDKSQELLAYLVDRQGAVVNRREVASVLYEEEDFTRPVQNELSRIVRWLTEDLQKVGLEELLLKEGKGYRINTSILSCDLYDHLDKINTTAFQGEYMEQYSWGEYRKAMMLFR